MPLSPTERSLRSIAAAHISWANCEDRSGRTAPARRALEERFVREADPSGDLAPDERARRAEHLRLAYYAQLALKSATARRARRSRAAGGGDTVDRQDPAQ